MFTNSLYVPFEKEKELNNPLYSLQWPVQHYRETINPATGTGLYEWENIQFVNTKSISKAATHFQKYGLYTDIDAEANPVEFKAFWDREEYRRRNGITLPLKSPPGGGLSDKDLLPVWIPGILYGHLNYGPIVRTKEEHELSVEDVDKLAAAEKAKFMKDKDLEDLFSGLSSREAKETTLDFPDFWDGHFHTYISKIVAKRLALDLGIAKARRKGFSYIGGWMAFDVYDLVPNSTVLLVAYDAKYLTKGDGLFTMVRRYSDHINKHTDWRKRKIKNTLDTLESGFRYSDSDEVHGFKSKVLALSAMNNPDCCRGKNSQLTLWEEMGTFPNFFDTHAATKSSSESGAYVVGQNVYWGTVGSDEADYEGLSDVFYNPAKYDCLPFNNIHDNNKEGTACGLWFGNLQNMLGAIDEHGNSLKEKAAALFAVQDEKKKANSDLIKYAKWKAERAVRPADALSVRGNNLFARYGEQLRLQIDKLDNDPEYRNIGKHGKYTIVNNRVKLITNTELETNGLTFHPPIISLPREMARDTDLHGCITEWFPPATITVDGVATVPKNLYFIWHDPYATDKNTKEIQQTDSLGAAYVYEMTNNFTQSRGTRLVASWLGRPDSTDEYNEQLFLLAQRYNAKIMFENDRGDVVPFAKRFGLTKFLMEEPEMMSLSTIAGKTGRRWGLSIQKHPDRKSTGALLLRDFLGGQSSIDEFSSEQSTFIQTIFCRRLLKELSVWSMHGNFDCVSACIVGMYQVREVIDIQLKQGDIENTLSLDDFWNRKFY